MTGHIGERINREVALVTDDFRLYHSLAPFFEEMGITILGLRPGEDVPASVRVLLDGPDEDVRSVPVHDDAEATYLATRQHLDERRTVRETGRYKRIVLGVDPGSVIGLAVLGDDLPLLCAESLDPGSAAARLAAWCEGLRGDEVHVHVGDGDRAVGLQIMGLVATRLPHARRSLVPEQATTPWSATTGSRHADAAIHIARREPIGPA